MSYKPEIDMDEAFDFVIKNMKMAMVEYVILNHYNEIRDFVLKNEAKPKDESWLDEIDDDDG